MNSTRTFSAIYLLLSVYIHKPEYKYQVVGNVYVQVAYSLMTYLSIFEAMLLK